MDSRTTCLLLSAAVALAGCGDRAAPAADAAAAHATREPAAPPPATAPAPPSPGAGAPIEVPSEHDVTMQPRQAPIDDAAATVIADAPLPENSDIGYRCEDGGRLRVVYTRAHANLSLGGVFLPLQPWLEETRRTGAEAWAGEHVALLRRGDVIELREADGALRRCRADPAA